MNAVELMQALVAFPTAHVIARRDAADDVRFTLCRDLRLALRFVATATCSALIHDARGSAIVNVNGRMPLYRARLTRRAEVRLLGGIEYARGRHIPDSHPSNTRKLWRLAEVPALAQTTLGAKP